MSKYTIFRMDHYDPAEAGKRRRRLSYLFAFSTVFFMLIFFLIREITKLNIITTYLLVMGGFTLFYFFTFRRMKSANRKLKAIGSIEFSQNNIVKIIGDLITEYDYASIDSLYLQKHIPSITVMEGKSGFLTHILSIEFKDSTRENIIVSDRPKDVRKNLSIVDTFRTLDKITTTQITIR